MGLFDSLGAALTHFAQSDLAKALESAAATELATGVLVPLSEGHSPHLKAGVQAQLDAFKPDLQAFVDQVLAETMSKAGIAADVQPIMTAAFDQFFSAEVETFLSKFGLS